MKFVLEPFDKKKESKARVARRAHFRVTAVSYVCSDHDTNGTEVVIKESVSIDAPMPLLGLIHPVDQWWVQSGRVYRTPFMTGSALG